MHSKHPFTEAIDLEIIMLAAAHFDWDLAAMIEAIHNNPHHPLKNYPLDRIEVIHHFQQNHPDELEECLPAPARKAIKDAQTLYEEMQATLHEDPDSLWGQIYALILYEGNDPYSLVDEIVLGDSSSVEALIEVLNNKHLFDPLYPGFGRSIPRIADALKGVGDEKAIAPLFEALLEQVTVIEDALIDALIFFQEPTRAFLLKELEHRPFSLRSTLAAKVLSFLKTNEVAITAIDALCDSSIQAHPALADYLIGLLDALDPEIQHSFLTQLLEESHFTASQRREIEVYLR